METYRRERKGTVAKKQESGESMSADIMEITPELAGDWLALNTNNRPLRDHHVRHLARLMEEGEWALNGETIKFNSRGELQDGQHRLAAIIVSDVTIKSVVVHHAPVNAFETIDQGKRRSFADALALQGEVNCMALAGVTSMHWRYEHRDFSSRSTISIHALLAHLQKHPGLREATRASAKLHNVGIHQSVAGTAMYLFTSLSDEDATTFFDSLATGLNLERTDPVYQLRERALANRNARLKMAGHELLALTIKAWNYWRLGRSVQILIWKARQGEPFPEAQ